MKKIQCPAKRVDVQQLQAELTAAGVVYDTFGRFGCVVAYSDQLVLTVADDADAAMVRQVVAAHVPPAEKTDAQNLREQSARALDDVDADSIRTRAFVAAMSEILNDLASRIIARQSPRTWSLQQIADVIRAKINALVSD